MTLLSFIHKWVTGVQIIGKLLLFEVALCALFGAVIGAFVLINLLPEIVLLGAFAVLMAVLGPWAMAEAWG